MSTASIIFLIISISLIVIPCIISICKNNTEWMMLSLLSLLTFFIFAITYWPNPTASDVRDGKAVYVKEDHVGVNPGGDTVFNYNTYKIEWLPEWEYGRKH